MGRKSTPKAEDVASVAVEAKPPKRVKRKSEEVIEKEGSMKKKKDQKKTDEKKNTIKHQESTSAVIKAVFAAKKKDRIWEDDTDSSSSDDVFDHKNDYSDSDSDVTEERNNVMVYIRDGCYMTEHLAQTGEILRRHLSSCGEITGVTTYGHPMNLERKARITFTSKEAVERALKLDQSKLWDGTPITVQVPGDLDSDSSG